MTEEMTSACYEKAKSIYPVKARITETARFIAEETGMNEGSAKYYVESFFCMRTGKRLKTAMAAEDVRYYFIHIYSDYGNEALANAVKSLQDYLAYDTQNHPGLQNIVNEFKQA